MDAEEKKVWEQVNLSFDEMNQTFDRIEKHFDEMSDKMYEKFDKDLEKGLKVNVTVGSWKNTVIERIMYFLLGGLIGFTIHYYFLCILLLRFANDNLIVGTIG